MTSRFNLIVFYTKAWLIFLAAIKREYTGKKLSIVCSAIIAEMCALYNSPSTVVFCLVVQTTHYETKQASQVEERRV